MKQITQFFLEGESPTLRNSETYAECSGVMQTKSKTNKLLSCFK